jgi:hypothetical protein
MYDSNMHGERIMIVEAKQARLLNNFKNTKCKLLRMNAAIWFNKMCRIRQIQPNYINIRINGQKQQDKKTTTQAIRYRINQEIKFLYHKKQQLNQRLYIEYLKCAQLYNGMWQYIQNNIEAKLSRDMDEVYERLNRKLNSLTHQNARQNSPQSRHKKHVHEKENRVVNLTNITFTKEQIKTLEMGPQYAIEKKPKLLY